MGALKIDEEQTLPINEIFQSIQGEGALAGTPAIFIRLSGCNLKCSFCDTKHEDVNFWMTPSEIANDIARLNSRIELVIITGGEPTLHDLHPLIFAINEAIYPRKIGIETNGTRMDALASLFEHDCYPEDLVWVTISPKIKDRAIQRAIDLYADEVKFIFTEDKIWEFYNFDELVDRKYIYMQPCSGDVRPALDFVLANPEWTLSVQLHKLLNIP